MKAKPQKIKKRATVKKPRAVSVKTKSAKEVCKGIQKSVDSALLSFPPKMQANIDQVMRTLDVSPIRLQDLRALGYRILKHATEISETLKGTTIVTKKTRGRKG